MSGEFDGIGGLLAGSEAERSPEQWAQQLEAEVMRDYDEWMAGERLAAAEERARETRLYWSGRPDPITRQILRAYGLRAADVGLVQRSAFSSGYRRRQRARVKRRRR
ncbi:hypothetical protein [Kitasatospora mediocidica]|uniref:hypothetical protein n=1 Tax=Kitasatospora mediocidica TaxID=58352 RepID=UPI0005692C73|nr:hypothetical protein [Kitasatospora mediocidica]